MPLLTRRSLVRGLFAAPAIVTFGSLMPVKAFALAEPNPSTIFGPDLLGWWYLHPDGRREDTLLKYRALYVGGEGDVVLKSAVSGTAVCIRRVPAGP